MQLNEVVPWGRGLREYKEMFSLSELDFQGEILGCGDGPASFNAEVTATGGKVTSVDPIYRFSASQIESRINEVSQNILAQLEINKANYVWTLFKNTGEVINNRMLAMNAFLKDYEKGKKSGRYIQAALPVLPFNEKHFSLGLCSHFLFLYSSHISEEQHIEGILELCRVAKEIRIYPLVTLDCSRSPHLVPVIKVLSAAGHNTEVVPVSYSFQRNATEMLVVKSA